MLIVPPVKTTATRGMERSAGWAGIAIVVAIGVRVRRGGGPVRGRGIGLRLFRRLDDLRRDPHGRRAQPGRDRLGDALRIDVRATVVTRELGPQRLDERVAVRA